MNVDIFLSYIRGVMNFWFFMRDRAPKNFIADSKNMTQIKYIFGIPSRMYNSKKIWLSHKSYQLSVRNLLANRLLLTILNLIFELIQMYHKHDFSLGELSYSISYEQNFIWDKCLLIWNFDMLILSCWWNPLLKIWSLHKGWNFCSLCICTVLIYDPT